MITTVMFDLDGTLLPFVQEDFVKVYFKELCLKLAPLGYKPEKVTESLWAGMKTMVKNNGGRLNSEVFWEVFNSFHKGLPDVRTLCDEFYVKEFDNVRSCLKRKADCKPVIHRLKKMGLRLVLATNPLFPLDGIATRLKWAELLPSDFELVTHYDNSSFCKPNLDYYKEIVEKIGVSPSECIMIGNNPLEDMCAGKMGMKTFFLPEFAENPSGIDISQYISGTLSDAEKYIAGLNA